MGLGGGGAARAHSRAAGLRVPMTNASFCWCSWKPSPAQQALPELSVRGAQTGPPQRPPGRACWGSGVRRVAGAGDQGRAAGAARGSSPSRLPSRPGSARGRRLPGFVAATRAVQRGTAGPGLAGRGRAATCGRRRPEPAALPAAQTARGAGPASWASPRLLSRRCR